MPDPFCQLGAMAVKIAVFASGVSTGIEDMLNL